MIVRLLSLSPHLLRLLRFPLRLPLPRAYVRGLLQQTPLYLDATLHDTQSLVVGMLPSRPAVNEVLPPLHLVKPLLPQQAFLLRS